MLVSEPFFEALKKVWDAGKIIDAIKGGYWNGDPPEDQRVKRPYLVTTALSEAPQHFTNASQYDLVVIEVAVVADTLEDAGQTLMDKVIGVTKAGVYTLPGKRVLRGLRPGPSRQEQQDHFWRVTVEFHARVGQAV
jgi:hypothetical protein